MNGNVCANVYEVSQFTAVEIATATPANVVEQ